MNTVMKVRYKFESQKPDGDLVCELTDFFDKYLVSKIKKHNRMIWGTYLYNDLDKNSDGTLCIAFRVPGATRGGVILERINENQFKVVAIHFNMDVCFEKFACYEESLKEDCSVLVDKILDFSDVQLRNNKVGV